ncbi:MAG TPA: hypothetical protein VGQ57_14855, partial [Polyangiaceae bacterium]|nr:hypothetical protein [Polyangiaceae bacterium]
ERLTALGFCPKSARYWAALPRDVDLFAADPLGADTDDLRRPASDGTSPYAELQNQAADPRVPLAGSGETSGFFLPWGLGPTPGDWQSADTGPGDALARDGLENFDASLFLDPELRGASLTNLGTTADYLAYQSPKPRRLRGIHALLGVEEATLVAVPDAAQRAWERVTVGEPAPPRPNPTSVSAMPCCDATTADRTFSPCDREPPKAPELDAPAVSDPSGSYSLDWTPVMDAVFELAEALEPDFEGALLFALDERTRIDFQGRGPGDYYYRVRARVRGIAGNWSTPRVVRVPLPAASRLDAPDAYRADTLLAVQRALLRLCAARGDLFAAISVPEHYLEEQVLEHAELLRSPLAADTAGVAPLGFAESNALSFGGLYYPWLIGREETASGELRSTPPEGAALGICARRSIERGAWVAPANEPLTGVVALRSRPQGERLERLYAAQINVVRRDPRGFLALGADTLSFAEELTAINVRRLLCLLRRAALQRGQEYVFEPNDAAFRRQVERGFEALLGDLYQRGAFAGASPQQAFQVVTGSDSNSASSVEQGRFFVDLKVAPSLPLSFLTVRLVQTSDRSSVTEVH